MITQSTPLFARCIDGVYLIVGWEYDGGRMDMIGVLIGDGIGKAMRVGPAKLFIDYAEAKKARPAK